MTPPRRAIRTWVLRVGAYLLLLLAAAPSLVALRWMKMPHSVVATTPAMLQLSHANLRISQPDGPELAAWLVAPFPDAQRCPKTLVVLLHGLGANRGQMITYANVAASAGYYSLLFDFRAHGDSEGWFSSFGWREQRDLNAALEDARKRGFSQFILWGLSMGAATAAMAAPQRNDIAGVILESPYDTLRNTLLLHTERIFFMPAHPFGDLVAFWFGLLGGFDVDRMNPEAALRSLNRPLPVFIIGSEEDRVMTPPMLRHLHDVAATPEKSIWIAPQGAHAAISIASGQEYRQRAMDFLNDHRDGFCR